MRRSQVIFRMPVDHVVAGLVTHSGSKHDVVLFIPPMEDLGWMLVNGPQFVPMMKGGAFCIVARDTIACLSVPELPMIPREDDLPVSRQLVAVTLRSGVVIEGELRFTALVDQQRTTDQLNEDDPLIIVHDAESAHYVPKAHIAQVEEK